MKYLPVLTAFILAFFVLSCKDKEANSPACEERCALEPDPGLCNAAFKKYYFDKTEKKCKEFTWGGCNGVVPFETLQECEDCDCK